MGTIDMRLAATAWRESISRRPDIVLSCACPAVFVIAAKKYSPRVRAQTGRVQSRPCISHSFSATLSVCSFKAPLNP